MQINRCKITFYENNYYIYYFISNELLAIYDIYQFCYIVFNHSIKRQKQTQNNWYFLVKNKRNRQGIFIRILLNFFQNNNQPENEVLPYVPLKLNTLSPLLQKLLVRTKSQTIGQRGDKLLLKQFWFVRHKSQIYGT